MSFGFSIGDIILVSQLSYNLYESITSGRRNAGRDLKELENVLFGLRCALDHLGRVAKNISTAAATSATDGAGGRTMQQALDQMIQNCATTLEDLASVTKKYREGAEQVDLEAEYTNMGPSQKRRKLLKRGINESWMKIRWDRDKDSLKVYREKLQSHVDSINLVLNTFLWSATEKIQTDGAIHAGKLQDFQDQVMKSNSSLELLVKGIHTMLLDSKPTSYPSMTPEPTVDGLGYDFGMSSHGAKSIGRGGTKSVAAHFAHQPMVNMLLIHSGMSFSPVISHVAANFHTPSSGPSKAGQKKLAVKRGGPPELAAKIVLLNTKRRTQGAKELATYKEGVMKTKPRPSFLEPKIQNVAQLDEGLDFIFSPLPRSTVNQLEIARRARSQDVVSWIQAFDTLLDSVSSLNPSSIRGDSGSDFSEQRNEMVNLLMKLNGVIEDSGANMRNSFYEASAAVQVDRVLDRFVTLTKSVRGQKEVDEFMDEREEWKSERK